ncbi:MAG: hypothetical protein C4305_08385 [Thermoleophilia bacterium]
MSSSAVFLFLPRPGRGRKEKAEERQEERALARLKAAIAPLESALGDRKRGKVDAATIASLAGTVQHRSGEDPGHGARVGAYCWLIALRLGIEAERAHEIGLASQLHDLGKLAVADSLLLKPGPLTPAERRAVERHAELGYRALASSPSPFSQLAALIALTHHERYDGSGYPRGLAQDEIPIEGRIAAVADVFDALVSPRPYRRALTVEDAAALVRQQAGTSFDPGVVVAFLASLEEVRPILLLP